MAYLSEAALEAALLARLRLPGYACESDDAIGPDAKRSERQSAFPARLEDALARYHANAITTQAEVWSAQWSAGR